MVSKMTNAVFFASGHVAHNEAFSVQSSRFFSCFFVCILVWVESSTQRLSRGFHGRGRSWRFHMVGRCFCPELFVACSNQAGRVERATRDVHACPERYVKSTRSYQTLWSPCVAEP